MLTAVEASFSGSHDGLTVLELSQKKKKKTGFKA